MIVEMRTYKLQPGKRSEFLEIFQTKSVPAHAEIGMKVLGPFLSVEDPDTFFFTEPLNHAIPRGSVWHNVKTIGRQASAGNLRSRYRGHWRSRAVTLSKDKFTSASAFIVKTKRRLPERHQAWGAPDFIKSKTNNI